MLIPFYTIEKQIGAKRLIILFASLSDSEREVGESEGRGQRPQSLFIFCTVCILFKLFLHWYNCNSSQNSIILRALRQFKK